MTHAYLFDVFGTLVDWHRGVATEAARAFDARGLSTDPFAFATHWRRLYDPAMARIRSGDRGYVPLDILHRENLDETLAHFDIADAFDDRARADLNQAWEKLPLARRHIGTLGSPTQPLSWRPVPTVPSP